MTKKNKAVPKKVRSIKCAKCGELLLKVYPWAAINLPQDANKWICTKCALKMRAP